MRIGGDFEIDVTKLSRTYEAEREPGPDLCRMWVDTGRSAIAIALDQIVKRGGERRAMLPAYICPSVVSAFNKSRFHIQYFSPFELEQSLQPEGNETVLFAHYFGQKNSALVDWIDDLENRSEIFVIEDCVQASLSTNVGVTGDYVVSSFRKFLQQPDGALLCSRSDIQGCELDEPDEEFVSSKFLAKLLRNTECEASQFLHLLSESEDRLEKSIPRKMSWLSTYLMHRTNIGEIKSKRRANWQLLFDQLEREGVFQHAVPFSREISAGEVPLGFAVQIRDGQRDRLRRYLAERNIFCPIHWELDHLVGREDEFPKEWALSQSILTLPIDQRMTQAHIEYMAKNIASYFG